MSAPASVEDLLQLVRKSGMVDDARLNTYLQSHAGTYDPADALAFADGMVRDGILTEFQKEQFLLGKWRGFTIGKYKLLERVGVGGMGQVFLGEHMFMKRRVAIKVLPPAKAEQPSALGRFYREARAAGSLEHPNIVRTHDIDQDGNLHFIVMEYVDGTNLLDMVRKHGTLDPGRAASYIRQIADGLEYAFRNGIVHRDVKPGNILVDRQGLAKILDMGLARFYRDTTDMLTVKYDDKIVLGTADYVAPEQVANSHEVDVRADIYALGASFYFVLAGHPPFPTGTVSQKLLWHRTKDPTPIREVRPDVPQGLAEIVAKMMAKDPNERFQTPAAAAAALAPWVPAHVPPPAVHEMPLFCPAVAEGMPPAELDASELEPDSSSQDSEPVALRAAKATPAPAAVRVPGSGTLAAVGSGIRTGLPPRSGGSGPHGVPKRTGLFAAPGPFGPPGLAQLPTEDTRRDLTPPHPRSPLPKSSRVAWGATDPLPVPKDEKGWVYTLAAAGVLAAAIAAAVAVWAFTG